jgi:hypothetical protein
MSHAIFLKYYSVHRDIALRTTLKAMNTLHKLTFEQRQKAYWNDLHQTLTQNKQQSEFVWNNNLEIIHVLNQIAKEPTSNQIYTPEGGWTNFRKAAYSPELGTIELHFTDTRLIKPMVLVYYRISGDDVTWNFFRLITGKLTSSGVYPKAQYDSNPNYYESVHQIIPLRYGRWEDWREEGGSVDFGESEQTFKRYYKGGDYIIASPASPIAKIMAECPTLYLEKGDIGFEVFIREVHKQICEA